VALPNVSSNTPSTGFISWTAASLTYAGKGYPLQAGSTNKRFVYWDGSASVPGVINEDGTITGGSSALVYVDVLPGQVPGDGTAWAKEDALLFLNKSGIGVYAPSTSVVDGSLLVSGSVLADAIGANQITAGKIDANAITTREIMSGTIQGDDIKANTITGGNIVAGSISTNALSVGSFGGNMLPNPFFEDWYQNADGSWPAMPEGWTLSTGTGFTGATATRETAATITGAVSLGITPAAGNSAAFYTTAMIPARPGEAIAFQAYYAGTGTQSVTNGVSLGVYYFDSAGSLITTQSTNGNITSNNSIDYVSHIATAPSNAKYLSPVAFVNAGVTQKVLWDELFLQQRVTTAQISDGAITIDKVDTKSLSALVVKADQLAPNSTLSSTINLTGSLVATGANGATVSFGGDGFEVLGPKDGGGNQPIYVQFPVDGRPNIIGGTMNATTLVVEGDPTTGSAATLRKTSQLDPDAMLQLTDQMRPPAAGPSTSSGSDTTNLSAGVVGKITGATYNPTGTIAYFTTVETTASAYVTRLYSVTFTAGRATAAALVGTVPQPSNDGKWYCRGITLVGGNYFYIWAYINPYVASDAVVTGAGTNSQQITVHTTTTGASTASYVFPANLGTSDLTIGNDGTDLWVGFSKVTSGTSFNVELRRYTYTTATKAFALAQTLTPSVTYNGGTGAVGMGLSSLDVGNFDLGSRRHVIGWMRSGSQAGLAEIMTDTTANASEQFGLYDRSGENAVMWKGTSHSDATGQFISISRDAYQPGNIYVSYYPSGTKGTWYAYATYYQNAGGGVAAGETTVSPVSTVVLQNRWPMTVATGNPPANQGVKVYISQTNSSTAAKLHVTSAINSPALATITSFNSAGAAPPAASTMPAVTPALISSSRTTTRTATFQTITAGSATATLVAGQSGTWLVGKTWPASGYVPTGTKILSVSGTTVTFSAAATTSVTGPVGFTFTVPQLEVRGDGFARISEMDTLLITSNTDASTASGNAPALRVGVPTGAHLRVDGDEIVAMQSDTAQGTLTINPGGSTTLTHINGTDMTLSAGASINGGVTAGASNFTSTLTVTSATTINGMLYANGGATVGANGLTSTGAISMNGGFNAASGTVTNALSAGSFTSNSSIWCNTLTVQNASTFAGATFTSLTMNGTVTMNGNHIDMNNGYIGSCSEVSNGPGVVKCNVANGGGKFSSAPNITFRVGTDPATVGTGTSVAFQPNRVAIGIDNYNVSGVPTSNASLVPLWASTINAFAAYNNASDARLKDNIEDVDEEFAASVVSRIRVRSFTMDEGHDPDLEVPDERTQYGVIAQETLDVLPSAILGSEERIYTASYQDIWALGLRTTQHLLKRVAELESKIEQLTAH